MSHPSGRSLSLRGIFTKVGPYYSVVVEPETLSQEESVVIPRRRNPGFADPPRPSLQRPPSRVISDTSASTIRASTMSLSPSG